MRAARKVFLEQGTHVPVSAVAKELGISAATIFVRMGTKKKLIAAALWPPDPPILEVLRAERLDDRGFVHQLTDVLLELTKFVSAEIPAAFALYAAGLRPTPDMDVSNTTPQRYRRALVRWMRHATRIGIVQCDPRMVTEVFLSALEARSMHNFLTSQAATDRETRAFVGELVATVLDGKIRHPE